jgi:hypothetical protein
VSGLVSETGAAGTTIAHLLFFKIQEPKFKGSSNGIKKQQKRHFGNAFANRVNRLFCLGWDSE